MKVAIFSLCPDLLTGIDTNITLAIKPINFLTLSFYRAHPTKETMWRQLILNHKLTKCSVERLPYDDIIDNCGNSCGHRTMGCRTAAKVGTFDSIFMKAPFPEFISRGNLELMYNDS